MSTERPDKKYVRRRLWWSIAVAVLLTCFLAALFWYRHRAAERAVAAALEELRTAGEPVSVADLRALYEQLPGDPETATLWIDAFDLLANAPLGNAELNLPIVGQGTESPAPGTAWKQLQVAERFLAQRAEAFNALHQAASRKVPARFDFNFGPLATNLPLIQGARVAARALALEANVRLHRQEPEGAVASTHAIFMLSRSHGGNFELADLLVRLAIDGIARQSIQQIAEAGGASSASLAQLQNDLRSCHYQEGLRRALLSERVNGILWFEMLSIESGVPFSVGGGSWIRTSQRDLAAYLDGMKELVQATELPWSEALVAAATIAQEASDRQVSLFNQSLETFSSQSLRNVNSYFSAVCRGSCQNRICDVGLAVERYRIEQGELPKVLDQLVPEFLPKVPDDPYSGEPLRYLIEENGYVVYSVGPNGVDDGGKSDDSRGPDLVFRVSRPSAD